MVGAICSRAIVGASRSFSGKGYGLQFHIKVRTRSGLRFGLGYFTVRVTLTEDWLWALGFGLWDLGLGVSNCYQ